MPPLSQHQASKFTKMLLIGDSGTGKTGSLASLVAAGYKLKILDCDNGLDALVNVIREKHPEKLDCVEYETVRDVYKGSAIGPVLSGTPAFSRALGLMDKWSDGSAPAKWGSEVIFVLDSFTFFSDLAFNWARSMNPGAKEPRQWYGTAQAAVESTLSQLTTANFETNVVVISHVSWIERPDGTMKGYPASVGKALGPTIPSYFNSVALCQSSGTGVNVKRTIQTAPTALIDLKNPAPFRMLPTLPQETGLSEFFKTVRG